MEHNERDALHKSYCLVSYAHFVINYSNGELATKCDRCSHPTLLSQARSNQISNMLGMCIDSRYAQVHPTYTAIHFC